MKSAKVSGGKSNEVRVVRFAARTFPTSLSERNLFNSASLYDFHVVSEIVTSIQKFSDPRVGFARASRIVAISWRRNCEGFHRSTPFPFYFRESWIGGRQQVIGLPVSRESTQTFEMLSFYSFVCEIVTRPPD